MDDLTIDQAPGHLGPDERAMSTLGWVLIAILVLVFLGVIGFSFSA